MLYAISERLSTEARAALLSEIVSDEAWLGDSEGTHDAQELAQVVQVWRLMSCACARNVSGQPAKM